jgi:hypothetical protein
MIVINSGSATIGTDDDGNEEVTIHGEAEITISF